MVLGKFLSESLLVFQGEQFEFLEPAGHCQPVLSEGEGFTTRRCCSAYSLLYKEEWRIFREYFVCYLDGSVILLTICSGEHDTSAVTGEWSQLTTVEGGDIDGLRGNLSAHGLMGEIKWSHCYIFFWVRIIFEKVSRAFMVLWCRAIPSDLLNPYTAGESPPTLPA